MINAFADHPVIAQIYIKAALNKLQELGEPSLAEFEEAARVREPLS